MDMPGDPSGDGLRLYEELAGWFHLLTAPEEYADEATVILGLLRDHVDGPLETLLELGSGGGNTASHLRAHLRLTLTDLSPAMLDLSRTLNPGCEHLVADMRSARLGRTFDAVLIHDAIMYMTTRADLRAALATAFVHLRPGGALVVAPDCVGEGADEVRMRYDRHVLGLFPRATWLDLLGEVGFERSAAVDGWQGDVFVGIRAAAPGRWYPGPG